MIKNINRSIKKKHKIVIVGATGRIGREVLNVLAEFQAEGKIFVDSVILLASRRSIGKKMSFNNKELIVLCLEDYNFVGSEIVIFCTKLDVSQTYMPIALQAKSIVIDNTSCFIMKDDVPLIIPEINQEKIIEYNNHNVISNPKCITIQMLLVLNLLHKRARIKRIIASTYQSTSSAGKSAMDELYTQTKKIFTNEAKRAEIFPKQIAFNCIPQIGNFIETGDTEEEWKIQEEIKKILGQEVKIGVTCIRVPVFVGHAISVNVEFDQPITKELAYEVLNEGEDKGVLIHDRLECGGYITQIDVVQEDAVYVSRIRKDHTVEHGLNMWIVADNLRRGVALNIVQIIELLTTQYLQSP